MDEINWDLWGPPFPSSLRHRIEQLHYNYHLSAIRRAGQTGKVFQRAKLWQAGIQRPWHKWPIPKDLYFVSRATIILAYACSRQRVLRKGKFLKGETLFPLLSVPLVRLCPAGIPDKGKEQRRNCCAGNNYPIPGKAVALEP